LWPYDGAMTTHRVTTTDRYDWPAFNLRMPDDLKVRLKQEAENNHRSLNSEIIARLHGSLEGYRR
jgi:predicted HicB family RNase H-like nuclease